jgi:outer membrane receptor protein involved in Fe transport
LPTEADTRKEKVTNSVIRNAQYTLQVGYEKNHSKSEDSRHTDNLFRYGHIGNFDVEWLPVEGESDYSRSPIEGIAHAGFLQTLNGYEAGEYNSALANYNIGLDPGFLTAYNTFNGFISGNFSTVWGLHTNVGAVYNIFNKGETDLYTFNANSSFDIFPGGSDKGRHNIEIGFTFEQRVNRSWGVAPFGLWTIARLQANNHIVGVDTNVVVGAFDGFFTPFTFEQFQTKIVEDNDLLFYKKIRELTGQSLHDYVNVDGLNPDDLSLDLFSASELTDQGIVNYFGFDYLGNTLPTSTKFEDFFSSVDAEGRRTFDVAPNKPVYASAYIQDKFTFRDIIFRLGLRVDRYDANTKVLKDPFSLYEITSARDFYSSTGQTQPGNVGDKFLVYVDGENSDVVKAFRDGEQWFFANGTPANDGNVIFGGEIVYPKLVDEDSDIRNKDFDPNSSFEDYEPQINWMPRLAFSFPISDEANFFAHYDILVQRPPSNTLATALDYYYFENPNRTPSNNPNLKPEKTIDYEVGFQQKLSNSSALKISAYYKELRNMIQSRTFLYLPAPVNQYDGFGNIDFGTVKGFSFQYDLRRTSNLEMTANYTLQFADGTGSNANSQRGLTSRGNIRTLFPLSFDERHRLVATADYRYGKGNRYNGPKWWGMDVLANAGLNVQATAVSGRPYTRRQRATPFGGTGFVGSINGARLPWNFSLDARIDKTFRVTPDNMKPVYLNVYLRVLNVLDKRNVIGVYPVTGTPDDDGYLISADGQSAQNTISLSGRDVDAYLASYQWALLNPDLYSLPRRMFLGAMMQF